MENVAKQTRGNDETNKNKRNINRKNVEWKVSFNEEEDLHRRKDLLFLVGLRLLFNLLSQSHSLSLSFTSM